MGIPNKSIRMTPQQHAIVKKIVASMKANSSFVDALNDFHDNWLIGEKKKVILKLQEEIAKSIGAAPPRQAPLDQPASQMMEPINRSLKTVTSMPADEGNDVSASLSEHPLNNLTTNKKVSGISAQGTSDPTTGNGQTGKAPSIIDKPEKTQITEVATTGIAATGPEGGEVMKKEQTIARKSIETQSRRRTATSESGMSILAIELPPVVRPPLPRVVSPLTAYAESLIDKRISTDDGQSRVMTRAEMEHDIQETMEVSRNAAQRAATNAVKRLDPDNPNRWGRKRPIARVVPMETREKMLKLRRQGLTLQQIAEQVGFDARIVRKYTAKAMRNQAVSP